MDHTTTKPDTPVTHAFTCDVEAWFHAHNLNIPKASWERLPTRLEQCMSDLLERLDRWNLRATFFVLGDAARRHPKLIKTIADSNHEVACHGWNHDVVSQLEPRSFHRDVLDARRYLQDVTGQPIEGYRAPAYSITPATAWALPVLAEVGFSYDSSIYPVRSPHGRYGWPGTPREPHELRHDDGSTIGLWEFPLPVLDLGPRKIPALTGGYLRLYPTCISQWALAQHNALRIPAVMNIHPWELDVELSRDGTCKISSEAMALVGQFSNTTKLKRWMHSQGTKRLLPRLEQLISTSQMRPLIELLNDRRLVKARSTSKETNSPRSELMDAATQEPAQQRRGDLSGMS
ncbi:MAG: DUF3473 domain-containing protein [Phycisphaerae bacterium]